MDLSRHFFIADDLDELDKVEVELESAGIPTAQAHVLTRDDAGVGHREHLNGVPSFMQRDVVNSAGTGTAMPAWLVAFENRTGKWWYWRMWRHV